MNWGQDINEYVTEITAPVDTVLLGRKLAQGFIPHWSANPDQPCAEKINSSQKIVFSKTMTSTEWQNTLLTNEELTPAIQRVKEQNGGDVITYGGGEFVSGLIGANLIDEYHLFVNPVMIGKGMTIFGSVQTKRELQLIKSKVFNNGIVLMVFKS